MTRQTLVSRIFTLYPTNLPSLQSRNYESVNFTLLPFNYSAPAFFKDVLEVSGFYNPEWCFPLLKGQKWVTDFSGFCNSEISKNRARYMICSDCIIRTPPKHPFSREKQFGLYNPNCISTNFKHVCNMNSHFMEQH